MTGVPRLRTLFSTAWVLLLPVIALLVADMYDGLRGAVLVLLLILFDTSFGIDNIAIRIGLLERISDRRIRWAIILTVIIVVLMLRGGFILLALAFLTQANPFQLISNLLSLPKELRPDAGVTLLVERNQQLFGGFGGIFLLLVFCDFLLGTLPFLSHLPRWARWVGKALTWLTATLGMALMVPERPWEVLEASLLGAGVYVLVRGVQSVVEARLGRSNERIEVQPSFRATFLAAPLLYLFFLDIIFSFARVLGGLAFSADPVLLALGLSSGLLLVRSVAGMRKSPLRRMEVAYLDRGADWTIGGCAILLCLSVRVDISSLATGFMVLGILIVVFVISYFFMRTPNSS